MKLLSSIVLGISITSLTQAIQWYPLNSKEEIPTDITPFQKGQEFQFDCIQRNIDNGEHKFDEKERILYGPFPKCKETSKPLSFKYGVNEDVNCTIQFTDELYHLFQLYVHEDAPFSCRLPLSSEPLSIEKGGAFIPFTFAFRGEVHEAHLDIDYSMNVLITKPSNNDPDQYTFISAISYGSGTNTSRIVIGDELTLNFAVRWFDHLSVANSKAAEFKENGLPYTDGFYKIPMNYIPISYTMLYFYVALACIVSGVVVIVGSYNWLSVKFTKNKYLHLDNEAVAKRD
ncbi:uncharacterized protein J8A68_002882 [[Candida] subhashii]|uniref:Uncharacterized protein n=1 Tax=[Candida] subhashii TaxID=561895 RepID=A0A8J5UIH5_9ASCO|nr:uncharacterized protein J8A68_002882 [[Candida] subhashii]KAG7663633.1 hypothetical protein J8A68_002882 [[Candida] subhashii]